MKNKINYFNKNGFAILKNVIKKNEIKILLNEIEIIKKKSYSNKK